MSTALYAHDCVRGETEREHALAVRAHLRCGALGGVPSFPYFCMQHRGHTGPHKDGAQAWYGERSPAPIPSRSPSGDKR